MGRGSPFRADISTSGLTGPSNCPSNSHPLGAPNLSWFQRSTTQVTFNHIPRVGEYIHTCRVTSVRTGKYATYNPPLRLPHLTLAPFNVRSLNSLDNQHNGAILCDITVISAVIASRRCIGLCVCFCLCFCWLTSGVLCPQPIPSSDTQLGHSDKYCFNITSIPAAADDTHTESQPPTPSSSWQSGPPAYLGSHKKNTKHCRQLDSKRLHPFVQPSSSAGLVSQPRDHFPGLAHNPPVIAVCYRPLSDPSSLSVPI